MTTPTDTGAAIRVMLADDHHITLWGLQRLIDGTPGRTQLVGTASSRRELLAHPALAQTDVIVLDLDLGGEAGIEALAELRERTAAKVLVLTGADDVALHREAMVKGARGVLHKSEPAPTILRAIEKVHAGEIWLNRSLLGDVMSHLTGAAPAAPGAGGGAAGEPARRIASLTPREREIVACIVDKAGHKLLAVAESLHMSENTLRNHLTTIYDKLRVRGRLELHLYATEHGLGRPTPRAA